MTNSVALCTYNGEKYLKEQLESILQQTIPVDEIVICDDGSTDGTKSILKEFQIKFPKIFRVFFNEENLGYVRNFEKALSLCTQEIIFLCDQDDIWQNNKVEEINKYFTQYPMIAVVAHDLELIGSYQGNKTFWELQNFGAEKQKLPQQELLQHILISGNTFPGMSMAIRKDLLNQYLPLQKVDQIIIHDYEIVIKSLRDEKFGIIKNALGGYRQHDEQSIGYKENETKSNSKLKEIHLLSKQYLRILSYSKIFNLNQKTANSLQKKIKKKYSVFLKSYPVIQRIFIHLKIKYYYKIIRF